METKPAKAPRVALDREAWIKGAIAILADHGAERLRVEVLAKRLGVTKGSFYWHFKDRRDLRDAVLEFWKEGRIRDIRKQTQAQPGGEAAALLHTIEVYASARNRKGIAIEAAVRDWARRDPQAVAVVEEVDVERLACACRLFLACGMEAEEAKARSVLLYAYVFGVSLMRYGGFTDDMASLKARIAERIAR
ncbi:TetR/AcrR family transcriptional regulator [Sulfuritalea sp.]|uniref:TetR/AcrR family transcriptional regulator n=1 Tax=Sulfuritalea sp. TaxID=2480090 RepID=UPI00286E441D|nr:TetR/AcrR family transcriptional regulator [Sulfuritalea sp.]